MVRRFAAALLAWLLSATVTLAQQIEAQPLTPLPPAVETTQPPVARPRPAAAAPMPAPLSLTLNVTFPLSTVVSSETRPPSAVNLIALPNKLPSAC